MKKKSNISFGPGASSLILIFVVLAMSVLGMLSLMNSRNDARLSERSVQVTEAVYTLNVKAEEKRAQLDAILVEAGKDANTEEEYLSAVEKALPEDVRLRERSLSWTETDGYRNLSCALEISPLGESPRAEWTLHHLTARTAEEDWEEDW